MDTSERLLKLLSLLQTRSDWTGSELAERLQVSGRTVRNDVERLRRLGYPVHASPGVGGGYRLGAGAALPPLLLDDEEAVAVAVGLRTAAGGAVAGIEETSLRALVKLEQVLPSRLRHRVNALHSAMAAVQTGGPTVDAEVLTAIAAAIRDRQRLRFDYRRHDGSASVRDVEPHRMVSWGRRWYLVAYDADRLPPAVELEPVDDRTCIATAGADDPAVLALYLGLLDVDFDILDAPELAEALARLAARYARASRSRPSRISSRPNWYSSP
jgi:predicted DNA-binding transcriptional regulator YafY